MHHALEVVAATHRFGSFAADALALEGTGLAFDARDMSASVKGHTTNFDGDANGLFTYSSPSTKYVRNSAGILVPGTTLRCDHDASGNKLGLLIEEQRTNLLLRSDDFGNASWQKDSGMSVTSNAGTGPDGATSADRITSDGSGTGRIFQTMSLPASTAYTKSYILKAETARYVNIAAGGTRFTGNTNHDRLNIFDLQTGSIVNNPGNNALSIEDFGGGWYCCNVGVTTDADVGSDTGSTYIKLTSSPTSLVAVAGSVLVWNGQFEAGAFRTSPIITAGSQVTRAADNVYLPTSAFPYSSSDGTYFVETLAQQAGSTRILGSFGTVSPFVFATTTSIGNYNGSVSLIKGAIPNLTAAFRKIALAYDATGREITAEGLAPATDANASGALSGSRLQLGSQSGTSLFANLWMKRMIYVPVRRNTQSLTA